MYIKWNDTIIRNKFEMESTNINRMITIVSIFRNEIGKPGSTICKIVTRVRIIRMQEIFDVYV